MDLNKPEKLTFRVDHFLGATSEWIDTQLNNRTCTIVLIGAETAGREWIDYEIVKSWNDGKGVLGIHIHNMKDFNGKKTTKGKNPFTGITVGEDKKNLSKVVKVYDPKLSDSKEVYNYIADNIEDWIEEAIEIRENFNKT
jgi:hypothetical protein